MNTQTANTVQTFLPITAGQAPTQSIALPPDPLDEDDQDDNNATPDYYYCNGCGKDVTHKPPGCECPRCTAIMEPQFF